MEVNPSFPAKTVPEFIAYAKANPRNIMMASAGPGSALGLYGELFKSMAGVDLAAVNYRGSSAALSDLIAGHVHVMFDPIASSVGYIKAGSAASLGSDDSQTHRGIAGRSNDRRICSGLRSERLAVRRRTRHRRSSPFSISS
jgi:tripartite-type tricarboxylate transporter receptor subunit TctC